MSKFRIIPLSVLTVSGLFLLSSGIVLADRTVVEEQSNVQAPVEHQEKHEHHIKIAEGLTLNDGQKWMMDKHTRAIFLKMSGYFLGLDYASSTEAELKDIGIKLQNYIDELISGCTMAGAEHDQLHVYLMEYIPAVEGLSKTGKIKYAETIAVYLEKYVEYFK